MTPADTSPSTDEPFICQECGAELPSPATYHTFDDCLAFMAERGKQPPYLSRGFGDDLKRAGEQKRRADR